MPIALLNYYAWKSRLASSDADRVESPAARIGTGAIRSSSDSAVIPLSAEAAHDDAFRPYRTSAHAVFDIVYHFVPIAVRILRGQVAGAWARSAGEELAGRQLV